VVSSLRVFRIKFCFHFLFFPYVILATPISSSLIWAMQLHLAKNTHYEALASRHGASYNYVILIIVLAYLVWVPIPVWTLKMEAARPSETSISNQYSTWRKNPENHELWWEYLLVFFCVVLWRQRSPACFNNNWEIFCNGGKLRTKKMTSWRVKSKVAPVLFLT
jgi:hypothetical protein